MTEKAFQIVNLPKVHWEARLDAIPTTCGHYPSYKAWIDDIQDKIKSGSNLLLWGDYGYGKSACGAIALKAALKWGLVGFWIMVDEYLNAKMEGIYYSDSQTVEERCRSVPLLVLDELILRDKAKEKEIMIEGLIRARLESKKSTIITTNHPPKFIADNYKGLASVFKGHFHCIQTRGKDFRSA